METEVSADGSEQAPAKVLLVDDHALVRGALRLSLKHYLPQVQVWDCGSVAEALKLLEATPIDVVVLDLNLRRGGHGLQLLAEIKARGLPARVLVLSADDAADTVLACLSAGAVGYVTKSSSDDSRLAQAIEAVHCGGLFLPDGLLDRTADFAEGGAVLPPGMTPRLREALYYLCQGLPNKSIANRMGISEGTVRKNYVTELLHSFGVARRTELIVEVARRGIRLERY